MAGIDAGHVYVVLLSYLALLGHALVHPLCEISAGVETDILVVKSVSYLDGGGLLVLCQLICHIRRGGRHECAGLELWST